MQAPNREILLKFQERFVTCLHHPVLTTAPDRGLLDSHISCCLASVTPAGLFARASTKAGVASGPPFVTPAPEPGSNHGSLCRRNRWGTSSTAEAATRTEAGPGSSPGRRLGDIQCKATGHRCVHAAGIGGRGDERACRRSLPWACRRGRGAPPGPAGLAEESGSRTHLAAMRRRSGFEDRAGHRTGFPSAA